MPVKNFSSTGGYAVDDTEVLNTSRALKNISAMHMVSDHFTDANKDTAWLLQMGGGAVSRWTGVKQAMSAIVSDTTLTSGAHFGYGPVSYTHLTLPTTGSV